MAGAKIIKKKILSTRNTRKITRTMEMVSTAKSKRMVDRTRAAKPYGEKLTEIMESLSSIGGKVESPFLRTVEEPKNMAILVVTSNRGLCGGYNSNLLRMARQRIEEHKSNGRTVAVHVIGKKGISFFRFQKIAVEKKYDNIDDTFKYQDADAIARSFMDDFEKHRYDAVEVISTVYYSSARQKPEITGLLPIGLQGSQETSTGKVEKEETSHAIANAIFEPNPEAILTKLIPHIIKSTMYRLLLEGVTSEWIYRRIAMKSATDSAGEMLKNYTRQYNRIRQSSITQEISEIVAGADAVG